MEALVKTDDWDAIRSLTHKVADKLSLRIDSGGVRPQGGWVGHLDDDERTRLNAVAEAMVSLEQETGYAKYTIQRLSRETTPEGGILAFREKVEKRIGWLAEALDDLGPVAFDVDDEFKHGPFRVVLMPDAIGGEDEAFALLDAVSSKLRGKFPDVLYGKVYVRRKLVARDMDAFSRASQGGTYDRKSDTVTISIEALGSMDNVGALIHEFGHRYEHKFLNGPKKDLFIELSTVGEVRRESFSLSERKQFVEDAMAMLQPSNPDFRLFNMSDRANDWFVSHPENKKLWDLVNAIEDRKDFSLVEEFRETLGMFGKSGDVELVISDYGRKPLHASSYGATKWTENFAETFRLFVTGGQLPEPLERFMRDL
jgi:hypothetical protein